MDGSSRRHRQRRPARRTAWREPRHRILAVCEGEVTEPEYLKGFGAWCKNALVDVEIAKERGVPLTLVEVAKRLKFDAAKEARARKDSFLAYDSVWCVFDVDEHPNIDEALDMARGNGIEVALSNPCFELWLLLHFRENPGPQGRKKMQKMVSDHLPDFKKHLDFDGLKAGYSQAVQRARRLDDAAAEAKEERRNPSTGVHRLTEAIRLFKPAGD